MSNVTAVPLAPVKRSYLVWLWAAIALAVVAAFLLARQGDAALLRESRGGGVVQTASGLRYKVIAPGSGGARPTVRDVALVNYQGRLLDGATFDKSQQPTPMPVIRGRARFLRGAETDAEGLQVPLLAAPCFGLWKQGSGGRSRRTPRSCSTWS